MSALERSSPKAARTAYATGLQKWPQHRISLLGLGNTAYAMGQRAEAARAFEATTQAHPDFADAWNNLAQVRLDLGDTDAARDAARRAVALGGLGVPLSDVAMLYAGIAERAQNQAVAVVRPKLRVASSRDAPQIAGVARRTKDGEAPAS